MQGDIVDVDGLGFVVHRRFSRFRVTWVLYQVPSMCYHGNLNAPTSRILIHEHSGISYRWHGFQRNRIPVMIILPFISYSWSLYVAVQHITKIFTNRSCHSPLSVICEQSTDKSDGTKRPIDVELGKSLFHNWLELCLYFTKNPTRPIAAPDAMDTGSGVIPTIWTRP